MPRRRYPSEKGRLFVQFDVQFPKEGELTAEQKRAIQAIFPRPPPPPPLETAEEMEFLDIDPSMPNPSVSAQFVVLNVTLSSFYFSLRTVSGICDGRRATRGTGSTSWGTCVPNPVRIFALTNAKSLCFCVREKNEVQPEGESGG